MDDRKKDYGKKDYSDMLGLAHHVSKSHPQMPMEKRAAQFSPFEALSGYAGEVRERARLTDHRAELDEDRKAELEWDFQALRRRLEQGEHPEVSLTQFVADEKKDGGAYIVVQGTVKRIDVVQRRIQFMDGQEIDMDSVYGLLSPI